MSERDCPDCQGADLSVDQHAEIAATLRAGELDLFARADLAADAVDLAEAEARVRTRRPRLLRPLLAGAAALLVGLGVFFALEGPAGEPQDGPEPDEEWHLAMGSVAQEREANLAFLSDPKTQARIAQVKAGQWIGIQHGKTMVVAGELGGLDLLLKKAENEGPMKGIETRRPRALHRFTFRKGAEGDRAYKTFVSKPPFVGAAFINHFGFHVAMGDGKVRYAHYKDGALQGSVLEIPLREGKGAELPLYVGEPTSMGGIGIGVGYSTASTPPLVLPNGVGFPRFEIPGKATLTGGSDHPGTFRRYMASVTIAVMGIREAFVEAIGNATTLERQDGSLRIGNQTWAPDSKEARAAAATAGRPLLILERARWMQRFPGNPFRGLPSEGLDAALAHYTLLWKESPKRTTWVGGGHAVPPAESRLTVVDPRDARIVRRLVVRPWTAPQQIVTLLSVGLREYEAPRAHNKAIDKNERTALQVLQAVIAPQAHIQAAGLIDADSDGVGEFATLAELTGASKGRMGAKLRPPLLPNSFMPKGPGNDLVLSGYRFRLFLPGRVGPNTVIGVVRGGGEVYRRAPGKGAGIPVVQPRADSSNVQVDKAETNWWAYAWPEELGVTGRRAFYVDQDGALWSTEPWAGVYEGSQAPPSADAAFAQPQRYPGGVSPALVSADGNRWREAKAPR